MAERPLSDAYKVEGATAQKTERPLSDAYEAVVSGQIWGARDPMTFPHPPSFLGWGSRAGPHGPKMDRCKGSVPWPDSVSQIQVRAFPISACALARLGCVPFPFSARALASFGQHFPVLGDRHPLTSLGQNWAKSSRFGRR
jgi:hypothetical protein